MAEWSSPPSSSHIQPLTPVFEVSEPLKSSSPYPDNSTEHVPVEREKIDDGDEIEPPPAADPFSWLFAYADRLDWALMVVGSLAAAAHGTALVIYLHYFAKKSLQATVGSSTGGPQRSGLGSTRCRISHRQENKRLQNCDQLSAPLSEPSYEEAKKKKVTTTKKSSK